MTFTGAYSLFVAWRGRAPRVFGPHHTDPGRLRQHFSAMADEAACDRPPPPGGTATSTPTGGRSCWRAARILAALREWFRRRGFVEVETPHLQVSPGNETHLHAFATELVGPGRHAAQPRYLHTSPEFACKKLLAAGEPRIFTFARVFRNRERGAAAPSGIHHAGMVPRQRALRRADGGLRGDPGRDREGRRRLQICDGRTAPPIPTRRRERLTVAARVRAVTPASICWRRCRTASRTASRWPRPRAPPASRSPPTTPGPTSSAACWSSGSSRSSASARATLLDQYPMPEAALARPTADPRVAERFELYACGVELANGYRRADRPGRAAPPLRGRDGGEGAPLRRALSDRRGFPRSARRHAAGVRHRARLRPAGDAGDRRARGSSRCCGRRSLAERSARATRRIDRARSPRPRFAQR